MRTIQEFVAKMEPESEYHKKIRVAETILQQLGGHKFIVMTGATRICALESGLQFSLPGGRGFAKQGINKVQIILNPSDTYTVKFMRIRHKHVDLEIDVISNHSDIYAEDLQELFTRKTGLETHL